MNRKSSFVYVISFVTQQIEELAINHRYEEVKGWIRITHYKEQSCLPVTKGIKFQFIIHGNLSHLVKIKWCKASTTTDKNRFSCLACD